MIGGKHKWHDREILELRGFEAGYETRPYIGDPIQSEQRQEQP